MTSLSLPLPLSHSHRRILLAALTVATTSCVTTGVAAARSPLQTRVGPFELETLVDGVPAATYAHAGDDYVLGHVGARYTLRIYNRSSRRAEAVVSVDGRDVIDGRPADFQAKRGYLIPAGGYVDIDGWRTSQAEVAAFRFSSVARSYAARTGSARDVGVIGVAIFPERYLPPPRPLYHPWRRDERYEGGDENENDAPPSAESAPRPQPPAAPSAGGAPSRDGAADKSMAEEGSAPRARSRPGLGTEFGEAVDSPVTEVPFARANPSRPSVLLGARYNDRAGLVAMGVDLEAPPWYSDAELRQTAEPFPMSQRRYAAPPPGWR